MLKSQKSNFIWLNWFNPYQYCRGFWWRRHWGIFGQIHGLFVVWSKLCFCIDKLFICRILEHLLLLTFSRICVTPHTLPLPRFNDLHSWRPLLPTDPGPHSGSSNRTSTIKRVKLQFHTEGLQQSLARKTLSSFNHWWFFLYRERVWTPTSKHVRTGWVRTCRRSVYFGSSKVSLSVHVVFKTRCITTYCNWSVYPPRDSGSFAMYWQQV